MADALQRVANAVREVVCRVDSPLVACSVVVVLLDDAVCGQVPHLRVALRQVRQTLLHAQKRLSSLVFTIAHRSKFCDGLFDRTRAVVAGVAGAFVVGSSALVVDFLSYELVSIAHTCL
jgi:hypothetical protein